MIAYLFAGQGSQYVGMGKELYDSFPQCKAVFEKADSVLGFSISQLCFEGPQEKLTQTHNCQPAILTVSIAAWEAFRSGRGTQEEGSAFVAGLSLGEYSALVAAGSLRFEDAVFLVRKRGEFMEEEAKRSPGKMLSVIGLDVKTVKEICRLTSTEVANVNCPGQIVISGTAEGIAEAEISAVQKGAKKTITLDVSGAFHSSLMKEASLKLSHILEPVTLHVPRYTFISNVSASEVASPHEIKENLVRQVSSSVLWQDSMEYMIAQGVRRFIEFGPGKVLKGLMRRINQDVAVENAS